MSRRFRPPAAIEADQEESAVSELSRDALHMTSLLRTGRRVGRHLYAQLGPKPSDDDPPVGTVDSPVLAERIVRAVNAAPPIAEQAVPRNVFEGRARDVARALGDAVEDDDVPRWCDVMERVRKLARPGPEPNPPDPGDGSGVDNTSGVTATGGRSAAPTRDALVAAFSDAEVTGDFFADDTVSWHKPEETEAERMADVALGVLRGGGADGEPEDAFRDAVVDLLRRVGRMRDNWAEANNARQNELWCSVHTAADHVEAILDAENAQPWVEELDRLDEEARRRRGGADGSGEDDDVADPCMEDAHGTCQAPGHDWHEGQRRRSSSPALAATTPTTSAYQRGTVAKAHELVTSAARQCVPTTPLRSTLERAATLLNGHRCAGEGNVGDEHPAVEALREALDYAGDDWPLKSSHIVDRLSTVKDTVARLEPWPVRGDGKGPQAPSAEEEAIGDLRDHLGLPKETPPSFVAAEAEMRAMPPTSTTTTAPLLRPDVLGKDAKWHERTDHSGTAIAIWLSEDDGAVWVTEDGEIAARSRYSGHYVSEWHGEAITAAHRWREDEMPVSRGEVVSGKRAENAPHGTTLVRVDETGRAFAGLSVIETDGGFNGSPTGRYRVLDLPEVQVGTSGGES